MAVRVLQNFLVFSNFFFQRISRSQHHRARTLAFLAVSFAGFSGAAYAQTAVAPTDPPAATAARDDKTDDARTIEARPETAPLPPVVTPPVIIVAPPTDSKTVTAENGNVTVTTGPQTTATGSVSVPGNVTEGGVPNVSVSQTDVATPAVAAPNVEKNADKTPADKDKKPGEKVPGVLPERGKFTITGTADRLSVFAVAVDAPELLTAIAAKADLKLLIDDEVSRKLTVNFVGRPAIQIVRDIAVAYGLGFAEIEGVFMVSEGIPRTPGSYLLSEIESVSTKYVDAANARNLLPVFLQDYVKVNSEQNAVVLSAPPDILNKFRDDIARFDTPASQILVDLLVVELTDTTLDQLSFDLNFSNAGKAFGFNSGGAFYRSVIDLPKAFTTTIRALEEKGRARVRANPRIATVSGRRASIFVGRQRYIVTPIDTGSGQRNFIDAGVRLNITPYTGGQGQILVDVDTEVSTLSAVDPVTRLPEKSTRTATSTVRVADGQTIVIGGLKQRETREVRTRVPVLGSLPLIGPLFRSKDIRSTDSELVIFITPRTLLDNGHLPAEEEAALKERFLKGPLKQALPPTNFNATPAQSVPPGALNAPRADDENASEIPAMDGR